MSATFLQNYSLVEEFFNHVETAPTALFEHLDVSFLKELPVFAPDPWERTREHGVPELFRGCLYCFSRERYGPRPIVEELADKSLWLQCGFDSDLSRQAITRFITDLSLVIEEVCTRLIEQVAVGGLLNNTFRIDSTDMSTLIQPMKRRRGTTIQQLRNVKTTMKRTTDDENTDDGGFYYGYGCLVVTTGPKVPVAAAFTEQKQVDQETARRVTEDALAVEKPWWMIGDAAFDMLEWAR